MNVTENLKNKEKAILVGIELPGISHFENEENLNELEQLALTAGVEVIEKVRQARNQVNPTYFIGAGKVSEIKEVMQMEKAGVAIFDDDLSPAQIRNLERELDVKIVDRSSLILEIFARHARTREAKTQVELAQLQHLLPRLTRQWVHLSRQVGGIGTRGPGETQLETDRRLIRKRIETLRRELEQIDRQRTVRRKNRTGQFRVALVGYTNVGKSTLMNLFTGSHVVVRDQLFATLDSTVRRVQLDGNQQILLSDTVGFIRKLPHQLVASFKSTLDEVREADLLLHVVDAGHRYFREQMHSVMTVLEELEAHHKPMLIVFNKIDLLSDKALISALKNQFPNSVFTSATRNMGAELLKQAILHIIEENYLRETLTFPSAYQKFLHLLHDMTVVEEQKFRDGMVRITFRTGRTNHDQIMNRFRELEHTKANVNTEEDTQ